MKKNLQTAFSNRQYMLSQDFEIYYYNDRKIPSVKSHAHDYYEFYFFLEGDVSITIGRDSYLLRPGDVILIPPDVPHFVTGRGEGLPYRRFVFWISRAFYEELRALSEDYAYLMHLADTSGRYIFHYDTISFNTLQSKVFELIDEVKSERFGRASRISLCVKDLILYLNRTVYEREHLPTPKVEVSLYQNVVQYIENHLDEDLTLERLAKEFYVSKYHIAHIFKDNIGLSVHQYIMQKRLTMCCNAILSHTSISEAYTQCGFKDYSSFYRAFVKKYGMSPKRYYSSRVK